ncbi:Nucleic acid dioxygenase ALKBH1 [Holothuria leucospilota]|uniref:Nucleic acid dioxygenase ALKBH1 n=1 Tax=Holothuria leucospilota TaxID=206669 RepID=A0A9Q1CGT5_HOLLE|nr:Nucleic acid dioxygenase ALKBH1 [Holothuria leucospilota]
MAAVVNHADEDNFKPVFKRYKNRKLNVDLSDVINFRKVDDQVVQSGSEEHLIKFNPSCEIADGLGLKPVCEWHCFTLKCAPGFIYIRNPFKYGHQRYWLKRLLQDIPNPANKSNLLGKLPDNELIWNLQVESQRSKNVGKSAYSQLRWVTFGYHYNWTTKLYDLEDYSKFPEDICLLSAFIATSLGFPAFKPEAAIVNYYNMNSTLGGHNDHSELDHDAPLISFSFGQSAIFLVGGLTKSVPPTPILLSSGDIIVLSSSSRLAYHGVPRILHDDSENMKKCFGKISETNGKAGFKDGVKDFEYSTTSKLIEIPNESLGGSCELSNKCKENSSFSEIKSKSCVTDSSNLQNFDQPREESISRNIPSAIRGGSNSSTSFNVDKRNKYDQKRMSKMGSGHGNDVNAEVFASDSTSIDLKRCSSCQHERTKVIPVSSVNEGFTDERCEFDHLKRFPDEKLLEGESASCVLPKAKRVKPDSNIWDCEMSFRKTFPNCNILLDHIKETTKVIQNDTVWKPFDEHLQNARLNVSVRQVNKI